MTSHTVGRGKPPVRTRFKKGKSGNPKGRPRKEVQAATQRDFDLTVINAMYKPVVVMRGGREETMPVLAAVIERLTAESLKGKAWAMKEFFGLIFTAISNQRARKPHLFQNLELLEKGLSETGETLDEVAQKIFNDMKRQTRE